MTDPTAEVRAYQVRNRAESFGAAAAEYDEHRPRYPAALMDDLVDALPAQRRTALDVGCGTGIASRMLMERGVDVLGVEIDPRMAEVARAQGVPVEVTPFERWAPAGRTFDLVVSGQAWHWIEPDTGLVKIARILRPAGSFAAFWNIPNVPDRLRVEIDAVYRVHATPGEVALPSRRRMVSDDEAAFRASGLFASVDRRTYDWNHRYSRTDWLALVETHSDHLVRPAAQAAALRSALGAAIDRHGGSVDVQYRTTALIAQGV